VSTTLHSYTIDVRGTPRPQGSIKAFARPGGGIATTYSDTVWRWRFQVQQAVAELGVAPLGGAVELRLGFDLLRPQSHFGTGRNASVVKASSPEWPTVAPDLDKLTRCICDAITDAGLWKDDSQVVYIQAAKRYVTEKPGVHIVVTELTP
jgi:Holliday junction resolvase RusA-like endonuclease